jgi:D-alanyl-D-alanine carboxypeptidase
MFPSAWKKAAAVVAVLLAGCAGPAATIAPLAPPVCDGPDLAGAYAAAQANAISLTTSPWMFSAGTDEKPEGPGWALYAPLVQHAIGSPCAASSAGFAHALAQWQAAHGLAADGIMSRATAGALKSGWQAHRAHVGRPCIALDHDATAPIPADDRYDGRDARLSPDALAAYLRLLAAARAALPAQFESGKLLLAVSPWRNPAADKAVCGQNPSMCNGTAKTAGCSAHWSGRAIDLNFGFIAGSDPTDSTYANRLLQAQSPLYAWMLDHAGQFGFVNYYYEPWHWEWQGEGL